MEETKTHTCYIEVDGNVITRDANGTLIQEFTGNWSVLHKVYRFATMTAAEKQKHIVERVPCIYALSFSPYRLRSRRTRFLLPRDKYRDKKPGR